MKPNPIKKRTFAENKEEKEDTNILVIQSKEYMNKNVDDGLTEEKREAYHREDEIKSPIQ